MAKELRIGALGGRQASGVPAFAVSRDSAGIQLAVRDNAAPQFGVERDSGGLLLSAWPVTPAVPAYTYTVPVIYLSYSEGHVRSWNYSGGSGQVAYDVARAGGASKQVLDNHIVGQSLTSYHEVFQAYMRFDTSVIPAGETVVGATLTLEGIGDYSETDFVIEARVYDCGDRINTSDYVAGADLAGLTLFATRDTALGELGAAVASRPVLFAEAAGAAAAINTSGVTGLLLCSDQTRLDVAPTTVDYATFGIGPPGNYLTITTNGPA